MFRNFKNILLKNRILYSIVLAGSIYSVCMFCANSNGYAAEDDENLRNNNITEGFRILTKDKYIYNKERMKHAINEAFKGREDAAIEEAVNVIEEPASLGEGEWLVPNYNFKVAKEILISNNKKALVRILQKYQKGDSITRGNIINVIAKFDNNDRRIKNLLVNALNDNNNYEEANEVNGENPLRVCDVAYNEIVLRYDIQEVPRTIGAIHRISVRDEQIEKLKKIIK